MQIKGVPFEQYERIVREVSFRLYDDNVIMHSDTRDESNSRGPRIRGRIVVRDSRGAGARTSWMGRHMPVACWHVFRDVFMAIFNAYPNAEIRTGLSVYKGRAGFLANYPETGNRNAGSMVQPVTLPQLCDCAGPDVIDPPWSTVDGETAMARAYRETERAARNAETTDEALAAWAAIFDPPEDAPTMRTSVGIVRTRD